MIEDRSTTLLAATALAAALIAAPGAFAAGSAPLAPGPAVCAGVPLPEGGPDYYAIELVPTGRVPGMRDAGGTAEVRHRGGPFTIGVGRDGAYAQDLRVDVRGVPAQSDGVLAVWLTTPQLDRVQPVGTLAGSGGLEADVSWNKFLVVVSFEPSVEAVGDRWSGPIVMRGSSRSGRMHTMAGHGPFQGEPCAKYGY